MLLVAAAVLLCALGLSPRKGEAAAQQNCGALAGEIKALEDERTSLQKELQKAAGSEKQGLVAQIKGINGQIQQKQAQLNQCQNNKDLLNKCSPAPDSYYKLPFGSEQGWVLARGNWNDPVNAHNAGDPHGMQAYAFDFMRDTNHDGVGESGQHILAARPGTVYDFEESQTGNTDQVSKLFFFKGDKYLRVDFATNKVDAGFPKSIAGNWHGFPHSWDSGVDAAVSWGDGKAYFFRGSEYLRYDIAADRVDSGFPKPIAGNWHGFPQSWNSGIDEVINWGNGKAYFFKGGEYLRYDIGADHVDAGYPQSIAGGNWKNFPAGWDSNIDAAIPSTFGRAILFKGDNALTVEEKTHKAIASPVSISSVVGNWPASWTKVDATLVWSHDGYTGVGNYLIIQHGDGTYAVYWHLQRHGVRVHVGDHVERGDWVAVSDNTGTSTTPHCHFDVRTGGDKAYPANQHEYPSIKIRFQDNNHNCWIPKVGDNLVSNN
jgi:hypothetical protein